MVARYFLAFTALSIGIAAFFGILGLLSGFFLLTAIELFVFSVAVMFVRAAIFLFLVFAVVLIASIIVTIINGAWRA